MSLKTLTMDRLDPTQYMAGLYDRQEPLGKRMGVSPAARWDGPPVKLGCTLSWKRCPALGESFLDSSRASKERVAARACQGWGWDSHGSPSGLNSGSKLWEDTCEHGHLRYENH